MSLSICCCWKPKKEIKPLSNSPNVIDVYLDAFNQYEPIVVTQPLSIQRQPRPLNDGSVHDLKKYENDPKGFNNFAFVDEIDIGQKSIKDNNIIENDINKSEPNKLSEIILKCENKELETYNKNESNNSTYDYFLNEINKLSDDKTLTTNNNRVLTNFVQQTTSPSSFSCQINNNNCTIQTIKNDEKIIETFDIDNKPFRYENQIGNITINNNNISVNSPTSHKNYIENISNDIININKNFDNVNQISYDYRPIITATSSSYNIQNNNCTITTIKNGIKTVETFDMGNSSSSTTFNNENQNNIHIDNVIIRNGKIQINSIGNTQDSDYILENAFQNYIENSGLKPYLENSFYDYPTERYATIKIHEDEFMIAIEIPKKIPKRKFPHAFDKKIEKSNDLKRKPQTNLIISKVQLLKEIPSDYCYATFRLSSLNAHNKLRAKHGCPPLVESNKLNDIAKDWAHHLAINNYEIYHRPNNKYGENLYWTTNPFGHAKMAIEAWYNEIELYDYYNPGFSKETGHFTQVLWKDTKELGSAIAKIGNSIWVVCNYNPPGNVDGKFNDFYVPRPIK